MGRPRKTEVIDEPEFVGNLPSRKDRGIWYRSLIPLLKAKRGWYLIRELDTIEQAWSAQGNLSQRMIKIPDPRGNWRFASRDRRVYALYEGPALPTPPPRKRKPRVTRKRKEAQA